MNIIEKLEKMGVALTDEARNQLNGDWVSSEEVKRKDTKITNLQAELEKSRNDKEEMLKKVESLTKDVEGKEELTKTINQLKTDLENQKAETAKKTEEYRVKGDVNNYLANKKFVNDITRDSFAEKLFVELSKDTAKGKSIDDIFTGLITDEKGEIKAGYLVEEPKKEQNDGRVKVVSGYSVGANNNSGASPNVKSMGRRLTIEERMKLKSGK